ncbi:uncharacterized protein LOC122869756 isoform X1 [Siniperca chuatsi]|uniref:uncharacterized protein LOC122869756 isoform X1 n=1 Tax=Siniperca chuatsi TaxID=119488 RepID=UPI001CE1DD3F|nr:uncharacterized protein LOC122869756 isoform X1 [Siniperca chuatsi]
MEHDYSLPVAARSVAEAVPVKRKRTGEPNDPRRLWDRKRGKTRVNIGVVFPRWRGLRDKLGLRKDADLACVLLETYQKGGPSTSTSSKRPGLPVETLSTMAPSCDSPSDSGSLDSATVPRILNGTGSRTRAGLVGKRYLNSVHDESTIGPAEDANDLQNAVIDSKDPDDDDTWETASEDSSSDEDCIPSICLSCFTAGCIAGYDKLPHVLQPEMFLLLTKASACLPATVRANFTTAFTRMKLLHAEGLAPLCQLGQNRSFQFVFLTRRRPPCTNQLRTENVFPVWWGRAGLACAEP